jgi:hypothetical protein
MLDNSYFEEVETEEPTEKETEVGTEPPTEEPTKPTDNLTSLYDDNNITIYYYGIEDEDNDYSEVEKIVSFLVKNKTDKQLSFRCDTITLNGYSYNEVWMDDPVAPKSKGIIKVDIEQNVFDENIESVGFVFDYFDSYISSERTINITAVADEINLN